VFKLAKNWKSFKNLLKIMRLTLKDISTFSVLLFIFIFTYTLIGMEWFAFKIKFVDEVKIDNINGVYVDSNFNTFYQSFIMVFDILTGDSWAMKYYQYYRGVNGVSASFFFLSIIVFGQYILLMLFLAILVENFDMESIKQ
jgi:hypothetical protein